MTENTIASITGVLLVISGVFNKYFKSKKVNTSTNYLYIFAGILLIVLGLIQVF